MTTAAHEDGCKLTMWFGFFLVCSIDLAIATTLLLAVGERLRRASRISGILLISAVAIGGSEITYHLWTLSPRLVGLADGFMIVVGFVVVATRPAWNAIGQLFFSAFVSGALAYLGFAGALTVAGHLSVVGAMASAVLLVLEFAALVLASSFAFETCDVVCRVRHTRRFPTFDPGHTPKVSLHIAAYNEPPDMLVAAIRSIERLDYPDFEIVVVDNNTSDRGTWGPVADYCKDRPDVRFLHVDPWPGYKSGALNLALIGHTDHDADIVGVVDADYFVDPDYLRETVGYFADDRVAFVQTPQDYRDYEGNSYLTACYDAYRYFFATAMPSRNERNSIIFAGTMGLIRKNLLSQIGGWDEWCITEDAETSLRLLKAGYSGVYVGRSFGRGVMPLTFASLKSQRFRWCFGGMQILRRHWRSLMPWDCSGDNKLSLGQRMDYLFGGLQWTNDLVLLAFTVVLVVIAALLLAGQRVAVRPLVGPTLLLPAILLFSGLVRALWALRTRTRVTYRRALLAFASWLSLSFTVARACIQGLTTSEGVFMRTPKTGGAHRLGAALAAARTETLIGAALWGCAAGLEVVTNPTPLLVGLMAWQGSIYLSSPVMSWMAQRTQLSPELERRRRTEERRERLSAVLRPIATGTTVAIVTAAVAFVAILAFGASHAGHPSNPFNIPTGPPRVPGGGVVTPSTRPNPGSGTSTSTVPASTTTAANGSSTTSSAGASTSTSTSASTSSTTVLPATTSR